MRHFEQALRADRPPSALSFATPSPLPATQGQRYAKWQREDIPCKLKAIDNCFL